MPEISPLTANSQTIAVTGASGKLGRALVPMLIQRGHRVILFGRNRQTLQALFPGAECVGNENIEDRLAKRDIDAVLDLAVVNNDVVASEAEFVACNVDRPIALVAAAERCGIAKVLLLSSTHALIPARDPYAQSKAQLRAWVLEHGPPSLQMLVLPKVYADSPVRKTIWREVLSAIKPVASMSEVLALVESALHSPAGEPHELHFLRSPPLLYRGISRFLDIAVALAVIVFLGWAMVLLALAIRLDSNGPGIFAQRRLGRDQKPFTLFKFRTMAINTPQAGTHEIGAIAVTKLGSTLRKSKLDELPQAINLLLGQLTLVGPRPCLPVQRELIAEREKHGIFATAPGITGLAQINAVDMSDPKRLVEWERNYLATRGLALDLAIMIRTLTGSGRGDRVAG